MNNLYDDDYRSMLSRFRLGDLKALLEAFGQNKVGRRAELRDQALQMLSSRPVGLNYVAYLSKIYEIYNRMPSQVADFSNNNMMYSYMQNQQRQMMSMNLMQFPQQRMYRALQYHQQPMHMPQAHAIIKTQEGMYGYSTGANTIPGNTMANNHSQNVSGSYQPAGPQIIVPSIHPIPSPRNQQNMHSVIQNTMNLALNPSSAGKNNASSQIVAKFKKIPFYDVIEDIFKLTLLEGSEMCTLPNSAEDMRQCTFKHTMTSEQSTLIAQNRDMSYDKTEYEYQYQIRFCQFEYGVGEVTDCLPHGLQIRVGKNYCTLPPTTRSQSGIKGRRMAVPINISHFLQLCPFVSNSITINWSPEEKKYAMAMFIVKQVSVDALIEKLLDKKVRSSEETKNCIIKKLTDVDPDLTATSSYNCSLVCPLSKVRMKIPAKFIHCDHIQCFDVGTFISLNEKKPKWMCPTCNKSCSYDDLQIENYFLEIIKSPKLQDDINEVEILADGSWTISEKNKATKNMNNTVDNKKKPNDFIDLDHSDNENCVELKQEPRPGGSECQETENSKPHLVDLTMDEDEEPSKQKD